MSRRTFSYGLGIDADDDDDSDVKHFREKKQQLYSINESEKQHMLRVVNANSGGDPTSINGPTFSTLSPVSGLSSAYSYQSSPMFPQTPATWASGVHMTNIGGHGFQQSFTATITPETPMGNLAANEWTAIPAYKCAAMQYHYHFSANVNRMYLSAYNDILQGNPDLFQLENGDVLTTTLSLSALNHKLRHETYNDLPIKAHMSVESILRHYRPLGVVENTSPTTRDTADLLHSAAAYNNDGDIGMFKTSKIVTTGLVYTYNVFTDYAQHVPDVLKHLELVSGSMDGAYCFFLLTPMAQKNDDKKFSHYMFLPFAVRNTLGLEHDMGNKELEYTYWKLDKSAGKLVQTTKTKLFKSRLLFIGQTSLCQGDNTLSGPKIMDMLAEDFDTNSNTPLQMQSKTSLNRTLLCSKDFMDKIKINLSLYNPLEYIP